MHDRMPPLFDLQICHIFLKSGPGGVVANVADEDQLCIQVITILLSCIVSVIIIVQGCSAASVLNSEHGGA